MQTCPHCVGLTSARLNLDENSGNSSNWVGAKAVRTALRTDLSP
jgi:hypothetical protein